MIWDQASPASKPVIAGLDDDQQLIQRFLEGEASAFTVLVNKYRKPVYQIAYRMTRNHQEADDLTQDTFVKAYQGLTKFRGDASFKTWLYRIATNLSINAKKSGRLRKDSGEAPDETSQIEEHHFVDDMMAQERKKKLYRAIETLPPRQRQALVLKSLQDMTCQEVAEIMRCSIGTVKANVFNAIKKLKVLVEGDLA